MNVRSFSKHLLKKNRWLSKCELKERVNTHRHDLKKRPKNNELTSRFGGISTNFEKDLDIMILNQNDELGSKASSHLNLMEDKFIF